MASLAGFRSQSRNPRTEKRQRETEDHSVLTVLHRVATRVAQAARPESVRDIVELLGTVMPCDSCFLYVLEDGELVLRASKNPHRGAVNRLGRTGWASRQGGLAVIPKHAESDPRFKLFNEQTEDRYQSFLSVPVVGRGRTAGVINLQSRTPYDFSESEIALVSALGYLIGTEIEIARLEKQNQELSKQLETRALVERAKGILQAELRITEQEAYQKLQRQSQKTRRSMKEIAEAVVLSHALRSYDHTPTLRNPPSSKVFSQSQALQ